MMPELLAEGRRLKERSPPISEGPRDVFASMEFHEADHLASLVPVIRYLRGAKRLRIPSVWRPLLPDQL